jgi:hypothetical protein
MKPGTVGEGSFGSWDRKESQRVPAPSRAAEDENYVILLYTATLVTLIALPTVKLLDTSSVVCRICTLLVFVNSGN